MPRKAIKACQGKGQGALPLREWPCPPSSSPDSVICVNLSIAARTHRSLGPGSASRLCMDYLGFKAYGSLCFWKSPACNQNGHTNAKCCGIQEGNLLHQESMGNLWSSWLVQRLWKAREETDKVSTVGSLGNTNYNALCLALWTDS